MRYAIVSQKIFTDLYIMVPSLDLDHYEIKVLSAQYTVRL